VGLPLCLSVPAERNGTLSHVTLAAMQPKYFSAFVNTIAETAA